VRIRLFVIGNNYLQLFGLGDTILRIKSCLCNNLCKHYLVEFLFYVCTFETYFYLIGI
jgi:hypothetical protein